MVDERENYSRSCVDSECALLEEKDSPKKYRRIFVLADKIKIRKRMPWRFLIRQLFCHCLWSMIRYETCPVALQGIEYSFSFLLFAIF